MENYDRDDAFFATVNNHRTMVDLDNTTKSRIEQNFPYIERAVENSIKAKEIEVRHEREIEKSKERFKKLVSTLLVASALLVPTAVLAGNSVVDGMKIDTAKEVCYNEVKRDLVSRRCAHYDVTALDDGSKIYKFILDDNNIAEYSFVGNDTIDYIYNMKSLLSEKDRKAIYADENCCVYTDSWCENYRADCIKNFD